MTQDDLGAATARILLDTHSVIYRPAQPFFFSSGWASPVYVDCKRLISYPVARNAVVENAVAKILAVGGYDAFDVIAGGEGGGVPFASMIADRLHLPLIVARRESKGLGAQAQVSGTFDAGRRILLVDDLTTDGRTKAAFCSGLRKAGAVVDFAFVLFKYGIFDHVVRDIEDAGINLFALATWDDVLRVARDRGVFSADILEGIEAYVADPIRWSERHGGLGRDAIEA